MPVLDRARLFANALAKRETVLTLDTNVLGQIYQFARAGSHNSDLTQFGLDQLLQVLTQPDYRTLVLAAGKGFEELPRALLHRFHNAYESFLSRYLRGFRIIHSRLHRDCRPRRRIRAFGTVPTMLKSLSHCLIRYCCYFRQFAWMAPRRMVSRDFADSSTS